jgi:hypothetical protein
MMQLTYRGIVYTHSSTPVARSTSAQSLLGKYRGVPCLIQYPKPAIRHKFNLKYRGAYYYPDCIYPSQSGLAPI